MEFFDSHSHYNDEKFNEDRQQIIEDTYKEGITKFVCAGYNITSSLKSLEMSKKYEFIYSICGISPNDIPQTEEELWKQLNEIEEIAKNNNKVVTIGEIGLDYYWNDEEQPDKEIQKEWFERQIVVAKEVKLPIIIHSREAAKDTYEIMKAQQAGENGGIVHCYSYSRELAGDFLDMGFSFGIGGVLTFKNSRKLKEVVEYLPMDSILLETDCPYLAPVPNRGKRNSSLNLPYVVQAISQIKKVEPERVIEITEKNARKLFRI